jgi:G3E family GTPase
MTTQPIPVTVLTGYLGSGKTTLLNRILRENHGQRIAVIENEFGEIGIDNELVIEADEEIFEMNNGCICCTVRGDLIRILGQLMKRRDKFDHIIIETTGMANPAPVAQTFWVDDDMKEMFSLDAIITIVDAKHVWQHIDDSDECKEQIGFADVILLNKTDLVTENELDQLSKRIQRMNSQAQVHQTENAAIGMDKILNIRAFDLAAKAEINPAFLTEELPFEWMGVYYLYNDDEYTVTFDAGPDPSMDALFIPLDKLDEEQLSKAKKKAVKQFSEAYKVLKSGKFIPSNGALSRLLIDEKKGASFRLHPHKTGLYALFTQHGPDEFNLMIQQNNIPVQAIQSEEYAHGHEHDETVESVGIESAGALNLQKLNQWIGWLLRERGTDIFRSKGVLNIANREERFVFQGVHMLFEAKSDRNWKPSEKRMNQLIFIGRNLDRQELTKGFNSCLASSR